MSEEAINQINERLDKVYQETIDELQQENQLLKIQVSSREEVANKYKNVIDEIKKVVNNQMNYREFVDIVNAIEEILDKAGDNNEYN